MAKRRMDENSGADHDAVVVSMPASGLSFVVIFVCTIVLLSIVNCLIENYRDEQREMKRRKVT
jgi:hypothetical protein